jgi:alginate O-acetyltransferase complex protein AlgI
MIFSTPAFLFLFLPPVLLLSLLLKREAQNALLLLASLAFYACGEGGLVLLLLGTALFNHLCALWIAGSAGLRRRAALAAGLAVNLGALAVGKYSGFILANLGLAAGARIHQPLGISFFTFMAVAYLVEVHRGAVPAERRFLRTALFIAFFPTVLAGPIHRYSRLREQLAERRASWAGRGEGVRRFIVGLAKKVLLADTLGRAVDAVFAVPGGELTAPLAWLGVAAYTLQIYLDFSGYSDMAIGLGRMFGFTFMENFAYPYAARSIKEFWERWHVSLSSWLRDFIFLPAAYAVSRRLGGERWLGVRVDAWCYYPAMLLTMLLCGLWHGAAWTFVAWGLWHGAFLMLERLALRRWLRRLWPPLQRAYMLLVVACGWVLFRAADFSHAAAIWRALAGLGTGDGRAHHPGLYAGAPVAVAMVAGALACLPLVPALRAAWAGANARLGGAARFWLLAGRQALALVLLASLLLASVMAMAAATYNPFIYFRF